MPPSAGNVITSPTDTVTGVPLFAAVDAVALNETVLFVPPVVAPIVTWLPVIAPGSQAFANCNVPVRRVFVNVQVTFALGMVRVPD